MRPCIVVALALIVHTGPALAEPHTQLVGQVTEPTTHRALEGVVITATSLDGTLTATTNAHGIYHLNLPDGGAYNVLVAFSGARHERIVSIDRGKLVAYDIALEIPGEVIVVHGTPPTQPTPVQGRLLMPRYSDRAIETDVWTRAWMLLDIDETGSVRRARFVHRPGSDLDELALEHVFGIKFSPALDAGGKPIRTIMLWTIEWPSYGWLRAINSGSIIRLPDSVSHKACRGTAPLNLDSVHPTLRDCTIPSLDEARSEPWISAP